MKFYRDHYDVIIIGAGLSGLSAALHLQSQGVKDILILEKHNLPGGLATSYVRHGFEIEATLHEMMSIGPKEDRLKVGKFFDEMGLSIDWLRVPEAYRFLEPSKNIDITLHAGFAKAADEIGEKYPGYREKVYDFLCLCGRVYDSMNYLSVNHTSRLKMLLNHNDFVKTAGYTAAEVMDTFDFPQEIKDILSAYWIYVGAPLDRLPFTIYAFLYADYLRGGSYVCKNYSHEMSMKLLQKAEENGAQVEFLQEVEKIMVKNGRVKGVLTKRGDEIGCDYCISGAYPHRVFTSMIEPKEEVPSSAIRQVNGLPLSVCPVSVMMILDGTPEEIGINDYNIFSAETMDPKAIWENEKGPGPYSYLTSICLNHSNPSCVPEGYTQFSITALPLVNSFLSVEPEDYPKLKERIGRELIEGYERMTGIIIHDRIHEIEVSTPVTISHYVGAWKGSIYGYLHTIENHAVARLQMKEEDRTIEGLEFACAAGMSGNGMGPAVTNGRAAAKNVLEAMAAADAKKGAL